MADQSSNLLKSIALQNCQGHPSSKLSKTPLRDISRLLVMFKDCLMIAGQRQSNNQRRDGLDFKASALEYVS